MGYSIVATPEIATARVRLDVSGGPAATPLYIFRRDSAGVGVVRDTSLATVLWPPNLITVAAVPVAAALPWAYSAGTTEVGTTTIVTTGDGPEGRPVAYQRRTITTAKTAGSSGTYHRSAAGSGPSGVAGDVRTFRIWHRQSFAGNVTLVAQFRLAGVVVGSSTAVVTPVAANTWALLTGTLTATGPYDNVQIWAQTTGAVGTYDNTEAQTLTGLGTVTVYDNEARQGETNVDYLLADGDGVQLASVRISLPLWGTWLKSPARPFLNTRCYLESEGAVKRPARREVVPIEGSTAPIVLSQQRTGKGGNVRLVALTAAVDAGLSRLLDQGDTLMLDTDPAWRLAYRYVNVGDVTIERSYWDDRGLTIAARTYELGDLVAVEAPIGVTAVEPGRTYSMLPTLFGSYAAMAATVSTYEELATGVA